MEINNKDFGLMAYLIFKHGGYIKNGYVMLPNPKMTLMDYIKEYQESEFSTYNDIIKNVIIETKGK